MDALLKLAMRDQIAAVERFQKTPYDNDNIWEAGAAKERMILKTCVALAVYFEIKLEEEDK